MLVTDIGFVGEHLATADLIKQGYHPFGAILPSSEVDMIAMKDGKTIRLQVKSGLPKENGLIEFDLRKSNRKHGNYTEDSFDYLCIVDGESGKVAYLKWSDYCSRMSLKVRTDRYIPSNYDRRRMGTYFKDLPKTIEECEHAVIPTYY